MLLKPAAEHIAIQKPGFPDTAFLDHCLKAWAQRPFKPARQRNRKALFRTIDDPLGHKPARGQLEQMFGMPAA